MTTKKVKKVTGIEFVASRKVVNQRGTLYVSLPKRFVERHGIKPGDNVSMVCGNFLKIIPSERGDY